jgi:transposase
MSNSHHSNCPLPSLGVDVSKRTLDVCLLVETKTYQAQFPNMEVGCQRLLSWLSSHGVERASVVMEATGCYHWLLCAIAHSQGHRVAVVNPRRILEYARSCGRRNKTDKVDAALIARFGAVQKTDPWQPMDPTQRALRDLVRRQEVLEAMIRAETNRLEAQAGLYPAVCKSIKNSIRATQRLLRELAKEIQALLKLSPSLHNDVLRLQSIQGVGAKTALLLVAEIPRHFLSARALCAWLGVTPRQCKSGTSVQRASRIGSEAPDLRAKLYWPAIVAKNRDPRFRAFAQRLEAKGKSKLSVAYAVLHKMLRCVYAILSDPAAVYDPKHAQTE